MHGHHGHNVGKSPVPAAVLDQQRSYMSPAATAPPVIVVEDSDDKDAKIAALEEEVAQLKQALSALQLSQSKSKRARGSET